LKGWAIVIASLRDWQPSIAPIVHPKINPGKEPFQCGMESADCGMGNPQIAPIYTEKKSAPFREICG
jgi:hypothetical protein